MPIAQNLIAIGVPPAQAEQLGYSNLTPIAATGTVVSTATQIKAFVTQLEVTASAGNTGIKLPPDADYQQNYVILNSSATTVLVYPPSGSSINELTTNAPIEIGTNVTCIFARIDRTRWSEFDNTPISGGTVTGIAIATDNGFAGSSSGGDTPTLTLETTQTGTIYGDGGALHGLSGTATTVLHGDASGVPTFAKVDLANDTTGRVPAVGLPLGTSGYALTGNGVSNPTFQGFIQTGIGAVTRTWNAKSSDFVSVKDFGAVGDGVTDDAPAFRLAYAACPDGGTIYLPSLSANSYYMNSSSNGAILDSTGALGNKAVSIIGGGWNLHPAGTASGSIIQLGSSIGDAVDFCHMAGTEQVSGIVWRDFAIAANGGFGGTRKGRNGLFIDASASNTFQVSSFLMEHVFIDTMKTGKSVRTLAGAGSTSGGFAFSALQNNYLSTTSFERCGDNILLDHNILGFEAQAGEGIGIYAYNITGAANFVARNNVIANADGQIVIDGGVAPIIAFNEFEQVPGSTNTIGGQVVLQGAQLSITDGLVIGNSFSQLSVVAAYANLNIAVSNGTMISGNRMSKQSDGTTQVVVNASATNTSIGENKYDTAGTPVTDTSFLTDAGTNTRILGSSQTYSNNYQFPSSPVLSNNVNNLDAYLEFAWTPTLVSAGGGVPIYGVQVGSGERIGRQITCRFFLSITGAGSLAAGALTIAGLPATSTATSSDYGSVSIAQWNGIGLDATYVHVGGVVAPSAVVAQLFESSNASGTNSVALQVGNISPTTFAIIGVIQYRV